MPCPDDARAGALARAGPALIAVSFRPAIPRRVAPQQSPLPLRQPPAYIPPLRAGVNPSARQPLSPFSCLSQGVQSTAMRHPRGSILHADPGSIFDAD
jgi:hypothetical protein